MLPPDPATYHARCLHNEGGEQLREAREQWKGRDNVGSWDAMIASQGEIMRGSEIPSHGEIMWGPEIAKQARELTRLRREYVRICASRSEVYAAMTDAEDAMEKLLDEEGGD